MITRMEPYQGLNVTYNITEDCNLRCAYCYEVDKQPHDLPLEYAKRFNTLLLSDPDPIGLKEPDMEWILESGVILDFIGGDALMRPKLVEAILRDFMFQSSVLEHRWARRWRANISTNGTLFSTPGVKEFLREFHHNLSIGVSVDGCPEVHNLNRSNSMDLILKDWQWYMDYEGENASTKATLNRQSIPYLYKSLKFLHEDLGLRHVNMNFIFEKMGETAEDLVILDEQMEQCVEYVLQHKDDLYWSMLDSLFDNAVCMKDPDKGWCGAGVMPTLGVNGKIYPCFRFMPHTMHDRNYDMSVGDIWEGFSRKENFNRVREQVRSKISEPKCMVCDIESSCAWCIGGAFSESGRFYRQTNICDVIKIQAKWAKDYWRRYGNAG